VKSFARPSRGFMHPLMLHVQSTRDSLAIDW
jgi:hypothetical protein